MIRVDSLIQTCEEIGVDASTVKQAETLHGFELSESIPVKELKRLSETTLVSLSESFNEGLTLRIGIPDISFPVLEIDEGQFVTEPGAALNSIHQRNDDLKLRLTISIDKASLIKQLHFDTDDFNCVLYLFEDNLLAFLGSPLTELDEYLFTDRHRPSVVVVISKDDVYYEGTLLTVTDLINAEQRMQSRSGINNRWRERIDRYHALASNNLNWSGFHFEHITPAHFLCKRKTDSLTDIDIIIADHLVHLCILFTANRSSIQDSCFQATFASPDNTASLKLEKEHGGLIEQGLLARLAIWPISGKETDRLTIFQTIVARESESDKPKQNYKEFILGLRHLLNESRWHHRVFLNGEIDKHFEQTEAVTTYVYGVANDVSQAIDAVTKGFVDTLLATVGVIVLTLLASLIKNETQNVIFRIGMLSYAGYLLLFQGVYRLGSIYHSYALLQQETDYRLETYAKKLGKDRMKKLVTPLSRRKQQFRFWFWLTAVAYVLVIIIIVVLSYALPQYLQQIGVANPIFTPTPQPPTPTP